MKFTPYDRIPPQKKPPMNYIHGGRVPGEKHHGRTRYLRGVRSAIVWSLVTWAALLFFVTRCGR